MSKATRGMYTTDGAGQEFLTAETEDAIIRRLCARAIFPCDLTPAEYDAEWEKELLALVEQVEDDYGDAMADEAENAADAREYWANQPGGEADYMY